MLLTNRRASRCLRLITRLIAVLVLTTAFYTPAQSGLGGLPKKRKGVPIEAHIKKLFDVIGQTTLGDRVKAGTGPDAPWVWPFYNGNRLLGYAFLTVEIAPLPGYSGKPIEALVAIDPEGNYRGVKILHHEEPIFLKGYNQDSLDKVADQYKGLKVQDNIKVRAPSDNSKRVDGNSYVDGISRATISVIILNESVIQSAIKVAAAKVEGFARLQTAKVNMDVVEKVSWDSMVEQGWIKRQRIYYGDVHKAFNGTKEVFEAAERQSADVDTFSDLQFVQVNIPSTGRYLLGDAGYERLITEELKSGENAILVLSNGPYSYLGEEFVARTVPERADIHQGDRSIEIRDVYFYNFYKPEWPADMPKFRQARIFRIDARDAFDPSSPWQFNLNVIRGGGRLKDEVKRSFSAGYKLPERLFIKPDPTATAAATPLWVELWKNRWLEIVGLLAGLSVLTAVVLYPKRFIKNPANFKKFRWAYLLYTIGFIGYFTQAQISVTHVLTLLQSFFDSSAASGLLLDPIICILGAYVLFTLIFWGRGFFCGWLCPFGAMQEVMSWLGKKLRAPQLKIAWITHSFGNKIKYVIFVGLAVVSVYSLGTAEVMSEVEPFKTAITLNFVRTWPFVVYAVVLLLASMFVHKFFCRYLCPLGAALAIAGKLRVIDFIARREQCGSPCQLCSVKCEIKAIKPEGEIDYDECVQCYECVVIHDDDKQCVPLVQERKQKARHTKATPHVPVTVKVREPKTLETA